MPEGGRGDALLSARQGDWLPKARERLSRDGFAVVADAVDPALLAATPAAMYRVRDRIEEEIGADRLARAGELGVLRLMMRYDPLFRRYLELPAVLAVVDATVSETAILHLQNGFILPSLPAEATPRVFQNSFHMDFRRVLNGYLASINVMVCISPFTRASGGTLVVPGSHQRAEPPSPASMDAAVAAVCPAGGMVLFDSTVWHAAGHNHSGGDRLAINHQFTRSWIKQQMDYCRALGAETMATLPARTQQLLGWYTRVPVDLEDYYKPPEDRLYRAGQG